MYQLKIKERAQKDMRKLAPSFRGRIAQLIRSLAKDPRPAGCQKLTNREEWRVRQGDYRVLYSIDDSKKLVTVVRIKHRAKVYKRK